MSAGSRFVLALALPGLVLVAEKAQAFDPFEVAGDNDDWKRATPADVLPFDQQWECFFYRSSAIHPAEAISSGPEVGGADPVDFYRIEDDLVGVDQVVVGVTVRTLGGRLNVALMTPNAAASVGGDSVAGVATLTQPASLQLASPTLSITTFGVPISGLYLRVAPEGSSTAAIPYSIEIEVRPRDLHSFPYLGGRFYYFGTHDLFADRPPDPDVTRAVVMVHGNGRSVRGYFGDAVNAVEAGLPGSPRREQVAVIAPFFAWADPDPNKSGECSPSDSLVWDNTWKYGGRALGVGSDSSSSAGDLRSGLPGFYSSSFAILDILVDELTDPFFFPDMDAVVVAGHSAGGQFTNRYAVATERPEQLAEQGKTMRFVVANPGSYLYLDSRRPVPTAGDFWSPPSTASMETAEEEIVPFYLTGQAGEALPEDRLRVTDMDCDGSGVVGQFVQFGPYVGYAPWARCRYSDYQSSGMGPGFPLWVRIDFGGSGYLPLTVEGRANALTECLEGRNAFNTYPRGLSIYQDEEELQRYSYVVRAYDRAGGQTDLVQRFTARPFTILVGALDTNLDFPQLIGNPEGGVSQICAQRLQGLHRLARGSWYFLHLLQQPRILDAPIPRWARVPGAGHDRFAMYASSAGRTALLSP